MEFHVVEGLDYDTIVVIPNCCHVCISTRSPYLYTGGIREER